MPGSSSSAAKADRSTKRCILCSDPLLPVSSMAYPIFWLSGALGGTGFSLCIFQVQAKTQLFVLGKNLLQFRRHLRAGVLPESHFRSIAPDDVVFLTPFRAQLRKIDEAVRAAAF